MLVTVRSALAAQVLSLDSIKNIMSLPALRRSGGGESRAEVTTFRTRFPIFLSHSSDVSSVALSVS